MLASRPASRILRLVPVVLVIFVLFSIFTGPPSLPNLSDLPKPSYAAFAKYNPWKKLGHAAARPKLRRPHYDPTDHCAMMDGIEDVFAIVKTGASMAADKLPVHFNTTLRCVPDYVIFSDYAETVAGHPVSDALDNVDPAITANHVEFDTYRRMLTQGKASLHSDEAGKDTAGWRLDKWKFLPMVDKVYQQRPNAKWYVFFEDDTYLSWPNLLQYLSQLDPTEPFYAGAQMWIGDRIFAHGGSGFVISNAALRMAAQGRRADLARWDQFTADEWAGDCVLGALMEDVGASLFGAWPNFQGENPRTVDFPTSPSDERFLWCQPVLTHHHVSPAEIRELDTFERLWMAASHGAPSTYRELLKDVIVPRLRKQAPQSHGWDNLADQETVELPQAADLSGALAQCTAVCEGDGGCFQFRVRPSEEEHEGHVCQWSRKIQLGDAVAGPDGGRIASGWMVERVDAFLRDTPGCEDALWVLP